MNVEIVDGCIKEPCKKCKGTGSIVTELKLAKARLSPRERDVLGALGLGLTYSAAAKRLGMSVNTIRHHVRNAYGKLNATTLLGALTAAHVLGEELP